ncbi:MAG: T9SS type A sorting domain-containing protein [Dysgonamonadaceae bacterium]|jgi:hypothetical protein|nr:T9SS type A sorting domain-containing protein [Dysgonamonadaceae bacterium]
MKNVICTFLTAMGFLFLTHQQANAFSGGSGTASAPYLVSNLADLGEVRSVATQNKCFKLTTDLTLSGEWVTIGAWGGDDAAGAFQGIFDGDGHTISGLQVTNGGDRGLFGWIKNATIKNLTVKTNATGISGNTDSGDNYAILAGSAGTAWIDGNCIFENVTVSGTVSGRNNCGGLVGQASHITITNCRANDVNVKGTGYNIAGLVACLGGGTDMPASIIRNCTVTNVQAESTADNAVAGLIGTVESDPGYAAIENCTVNNPTIRLAGPDKWLGAGLIGKIWRAHIKDCTVNNPVFRGSFFAGGGLIGEIGSEWYEGTLLTTIDNCHVNNAQFPEGEWRCGGFAGLFYNNATITNCSASSTITTVGDMAGFIGRIVSTGTISNCQAYANITTGTWSQISGGFVFSLEAGTIDNCLFVGTITHNDLAETHGESKVGGFAGTSAGIIKNSAAIATVISNIDVSRSYGVGGFVGVLNEGSNTAGTIENCYFSGSVKGNGIVGGFVGFNNYTNKSAALKNCYAHATVEPVNDATAIGGFVGITSNGGAPISNSYFIGSVVGNGNPFAGTIAGYAEDGAVVTGCAAQALSGLDGIGFDEAGTITVTSVATADLKKQSAWNAAWFSGNYAINEGVSYPYLSSQSTPVQITSLNANTISGKVPAANEKIAVFQDYKTKEVTASLQGLNWSATFASAIQNGDKVSVVNYETGKPASYPVIQDQFISTGLAAINRGGGDCRLYVDQNTHSLLVNASSSIQKIELFNATGSVITRKNVNQLSPAQVSLSVPATGAYIVKITTTEGVTTKKVVL